jgi:hypothetical protein
MTRINQTDIKAACLQQLEQRNPIDAGALHGDGLDTAFRKPSRGRFQILGELAEPTHWFFGSILRNRNVIAGLSDVDTGSIRPDLGSRTRRFSDFRIGRFHRFSIAIIAEIGFGRERVDSLLSGITASPGDRCVTSDQTTRPNAMLNIGLVEANQ